MCIRDSPYSYRNKTNKNTKTNALPIRTVGLMDVGSSMLSNGPIIAGPRSPQTTKNAMHVPSIKPMMLNSTANFPVGPKVWNATQTNRNS